MPAEVKYLFRILAGPLSNLWRTEQSIKVIKPYVLSYRNRNRGGNPSVKQIQEKLRELPWDDFVYTFSYECVSELQRTGRQSLIKLFLSPATGASVRRMTENTHTNADNAHHNESDATLREDALVGLTIESRVASDAWPPKQKRVQLFDREDLARVRLHSVY